MVPQLPARRLTVPCHAEEGADGLKARNGPGHTDPRPGNGQVQYDGNFTQALEQRSSLFITRALTKQASQTGQLANLTLVSYSLHPSTRSPHPTCALSRRSRTPAASSSPTSPSHTREGFQWLPNLFCLVHPWHIPKLLLVLFCCAIFTRRCSGANLILEPKLKVPAVWETPHSDIQLGNTHSVTHLISLKIKTKSPKN